MTKIEWHREKTEGVNGAIEYHLYLDGRHAGYLTKSNDPNSPVYLFKSNKELDGIVCGNTLVEAKASIKADSGWLNQNNRLDFSIKKCVDDLEIEKITPCKIGSYVMITIDEAQKLLKLADYEVDKRSLDRLITHEAYMLYPNEVSYFTLRPSMQTKICRKGLNWLAHKYGKPNDNFNKAVDKVFSKVKTGVDDHEIKKITPRKVGHYLMITIDEAQKLLKLVNYDADKSRLNTQIYDTCLLLAEQGQKENSYFLAKPFTTTMISRKGLTWLAYEYGEPNNSFNEAVDMIFSKAKKA